MLDDFVVVTITRPGPLSVRLKPDPRGLVLLNNFDSLPDDPHTSCPRLGPLESVGSVMPGDALVRESLLLETFHLSSTKGFEIQLRWYQLADLAYAFASNETVSISRFVL